MGRGITRPYVPPSQDSLFEGYVPETIYENIEDIYKYQINVIHPATIIHDGLRMLNFPAFVKAMKELIKGRVLKSLWHIVSRTYRHRSHRPFVSPRIRNGVIVD